MPTAGQHTLHAEHNIRFLENFYNSYNFNDWAITVSFYIAVHIIEAAIFNKKKIKIGTHTVDIEHSEQLSQHSDILPKAGISRHELRNIIARENFAEIYNYLKPLYNDCQIARYIHYSFDKIKVELLAKTCLKEIINWSNKNSATSFKINLK